MKQSITIAGNIIVDSNKYIEIYPEEGHLSYVKHVKTSLGGCVPNTGISLKVIDPSINVMAMGLIGDDDNGIYALRIFNEESINIDNIDIIKGGSTSHVDAYVNTKNALRTFLVQEGVSQMFGTSIKPIKTPYLHVGYILLLPYLDEILDDGRTRMSHWLEDVSNQGVIISADIVSEESDRYQQVIASSLKFINHLIINEIEASRLSSIDVYNNGKLDVNQLMECAKIIKELGVKNYVVIHAPSISIIHDGFHTTHLKSLNIPKESIVNTVGAGDAFCAATLYGIMNKMRPKEILRLASCVAADVLMSQTPKPTLVSINDFLLLEKHFGRQE